jgi:hypothetical protein
MSSTVDNVRPAEVPDYPWAVRVLLELMDENVLVCPKHGTEFKPLGFGGRDGTTHRSICQVKDGNHLFDTHLLCLHMSKESFGKSARRFFGREDHRREALEEFEEINAEFGGKFNALDKDDLAKELDEVKEKIFSTPPQERSTNHFASLEKDARELKEVIRKIEDEEDEKRMKEVIVIGDEEDQKVEENVFQVVQARDKGRPTGGNTLTSKLVAGAGGTTITRLERVPTRLAPRQPEGVKRVKRAVDAILTPVKQKEDDREKALLREKVEELTAKLAKMEEALAKALSDRENAKANQVVGSPRREAMTFRDAAELDGERWITVDHGRGIRSIQVATSPVKVSNTFGALEDTVDPVVEEAPARWEEAATPRPVFGPKNREVKPVYVIADRERIKDVKGKLSKVGVDKFDYDFVHWEGLKVLGVYAKADKAMEVRKKIVASGGRVLDDFDPLEPRFASLILGGKPDEMSNSAWQKVLVESAHRVLEQKLEGIKAISHVGVQKAIRASLAPTAAKIFRKEDEAGNARKDRPTYSLFKAAWISPGDKADGPKSGGPREFSLFDILKSMAPEVAAAAEGAMEVVQDGPTETKQAPSN